MVSFPKLLETKESSKVPLLNENTFISSNGQGKNYLQNFYVKTLWERFKKSPEYISVSRTVLDDVFAETPKFTDLNDVPLSKEERRKAMDLWTSQMYSTAQGAMLDYIAMGHGIFWKGKLEKSKIKEVSSNMIRHFKSLGLNKPNLIKNIQTQLVKKTMIDYIPYSTATFVTNETEITNIIQDVSGYKTQRNYNKKQFALMKFMEMDGRAKGVIPFEALSEELLQMWLMKQDATSYLRNGSGIGKLFVLKDDVAGSANHKFLTSTISQFNYSENKGGHLVATGDVTVQDLTKGLEDMAYKDLSLFIISKLAWFFGISSDRLPFLIGKAASGGDSGGVGEKGYYNFISRIINELQATLNSFYYRDLGWKIWIPKKYKQDDVREAQTMQMKASAIEQLNTILASSNQKLSNEYISKLMDIPLDDIKTIPMSERMIPEASGLNNQNMLSNDDVNKEPDNRKRANTKRNVANNKSNREASV